MSTYISHKPTNVSSPFVSWSNLTLALDCWNRLGCLPFLKEGPAMKGLIINHRIALNKSKSIYCTSLYVSDPATQQACLRSQSAKIYYYYRYYYRAYLAYYGQSKWLMGKYQYQTIEIHRLNTDSFFFVSTDKVWQISQHILGGSCSHSVNSGNIRYLMIINSECIGSWLLGLFI